MRTRATQTTSQFVNLDGLAVMLEVSRRTAERMRQRDELSVRPVNEGTRTHPRWLRSEVQSAIDAGLIYKPKAASK